MDTHLCRCDLGDLCVCGEVGVCLDMALLVRVVPEGSAETVGREGGLAVLCSDVATEVDAVLSALREARVGLDRVCVSDEGYRQKSPTFHGEGAPANDTGLMASSKGPALTRTAKGRVASANRIAKEKKKKKRK